MSGCNRKATGRYFSEVGMQSSKQAKVQQVRSPDRVIINDVGPRDGLQNQAKILILRAHVHGYLRARDVADNAVAHTQGAAAEADSGDQAS